MRYSYFTEKGRRETNDDVVFCFENSERALFMVGDGMGGYQFGDLAANLIIDTIANDLLNFPTEFIEEGILSACFKAHQRVKEKFDEAGATLGGLLVYKTKGYLFWAGDVRIVIKNGSQYISSTDHTLYNLLRSENVLVKPEDVGRDKNIVIRSVGGKSSAFSPEIFKFEIGDPFVGIICSDGVHKNMQNEDFRNLLECEMEISVQKLQEYGIESGDNFSAIFFSR